MPIFHHSENIDVADSDFYDVKGDVNITFDQRMNVNPIANMVASYAPPQGERYCHIYLEDEDDDDSDSDVDHEPEDEDDKSEKEEDGVEAPSPRPKLIDKPQRASQVSRLVNPITQLKSTSSPSATAVSASGSQRVKGLLNLLPTTPSKPAFDKAAFQCNALKLLNPTLPKPASDKAREALKLHQQDLLNRLLLPKPAPAKSASDTELAFKLYKQNLLRQGLPKTSQSKVASDTAELALKFYQQNVLNHRLLPKTAPAKPTVNKAAPEHEQDMLKKAPSTPAFDKAQFERNLEDLKRRVKSLEDSHHDPVFPARGRTEAQNSSPSVYCHGLASASVDAPPPGNQILMDTPDPRACPSYPLPAESSRTTGTCEYYWIPPSTQKQSVPQWGVVGTPYVYYACSPTYQYPSASTPHFSQASASSSNATPRTWHN